MTADEDVLADLTGSAARFLRDRWPLDADQPTEGVRPQDASALWRAAGQLGWDSVVAGKRPEDALAAAPLLAGLFGVVGRHPAPLPMLDLAVAIPVLATVDRTGTLARLLAGGRLAVHAGAVDPARPDDGPWAGITVHDGRATGSRSLVAHAQVSDAFVVSATVDGRPGWVLIEKAAAGVEVSPLRSYDRLDLPGLVKLDGANAALIADGDDALRAAMVISVLSRTVTVAELAGLGEAAIRLTVEYVRERTQFGRPIGSFQAIKHLLAEAWIDVYACESTATTVARQVAETGSAADAAEAADLALVFAAGASRRVLEAALQAHGGIGFTLDYRLSWYFNRALSRGSLLARPQQLATDLGRALLTTAEAAAS